MAKPRVTERITPEGLAVLRLFKKLKRRPFVKEGYPSENSDTFDPHGDKVTVLMVAAIHEFGTENGNIPERSHLRSSFDDNRQKLNLFAFKVSQMLIDGTLSLEKGLNRIGLKMLNNHKKKIKSNIPPELSDATKKQRERKGSKNPKALIDTAQLLNSATIKRIMKS